MKFETFRDLKLETTKDSFIKIHYIISKDLKMLLNKSGTTELNQRDVIKIKYYVEALKIIGEKTESDKDEKVSINLNFSEARINAN